MNNKVNIIGAGLAGCEAAYQLIKRNIPVNLYEMRGHKQTEAHKTDLFGELVCSNSLRSAQIENAVGLLKEEMRILDSLIMRAADYARIPAGGALAVDRDMFSGYITDYLKQHPLINFINKEVEHIPGRLSVIATGPLTSAVFNKSIQDFFGFEHLHFYDAIAPIVTEESINREKVYLKSRYDKGEAAYYNCPMTKYDFDVFYEELMGAERVIPRDFEVFEGCMAIEDMAFRGKETLLYGPMKPVGLTNPKTKELPYAVVQLRADDAARTMYNIVGFQTRLKYPEQLRILRLIPGLENCRIIRYGAMHRNTFINSPKLLNKYYQTKQRDTLFFAGQITGVEGYLESASSGLVAGVNVARFLTGRPFIDFGSRTVIGALANYISLPNEHFQPMNANFGIVAPLEGHYKKRERRKVIVERSLSNIRELAVEINE